MKLAIQRALNEVNRPTDSGDMAVGAKVICKLKLWTAAILNLCKITTFPVSKSWRLFICSSEGPNKQVKAKNPSIAICSRSSPTLTGLLEGESQISESSTIPYPVGLPQLSGSDKPNLKTNTTQTTTTTSTKTLMDCLLSPEPTL